MMPIPFQGEPIKSFGEGFDRGLNMYNAIMNARMESARQKLMAQQQARLARMEPYEAMFKYGSGLNNMLQGVQSARVLNMMNPEASIDFSALQNGLQGLGINLNDLNRPTDAIETGNIIPERTNFPNRMIPLPENIKSKNNNTYNNIPPLPGAINVARDQENLMDKFISNNVSSLPMGQSVTVDQGDPKLAWKNEQKEPYRVEKDGILTSIYPNGKKVIERVGPSKEQEASISIQKDIESQELKDRTETIIEAKHDIPEIERLLDNMRRMKVLIENNPSMFGHYVLGEDWANLLSTNPNSGKLKTLLEDFVVDVEKKVSSRGSQLALQFAKGQKPNPAQHQKVALGIAEESIRKAEERLKLVKRYAKGDFSEQSNLRHLSDEELERITAGVQ